MEKQQEGEQEQGDSAEDEGMDVDRKLPKDYANQVSVLICLFYFYIYIFPTLILYLDRQMALVL